MSLQIVATDLDGDPLSYGASDLPDGLAIDPVTGEIAGMVMPGAEGVYPTTVTVDDGTDPVQIAFQWTVSSGTNQAPDVTNPGSQANVEDDDIVLQIAASDFEDDPLTYAAAGLPPFLSIDPNTGEISGRIGFGSAAIYDVTVSVDDGVDTTHVDFQWTVGLPASPEIPAEVGVVSVNNTGWTTVPLAHGYTSMVVVATPLYTLASPAPCAACAQRKRRELRDPSRPHGRQHGSDHDDGPLPGDPGGRVRPGHLRPAARGGQVPLDHHRRPQQLERRQPRLPPELHGAGGDRSGADCERSAPDELLVVRHRPHHGAGPPPPLDRETVHADPDSERADEVVGYVVMEAGTWTLAGRTMEAGLGSDTVRGVGNGPPYDYPLSLSSARSRSRPWPDSMAVTGAGRCSTTRSTPAGRC